MPVIRAADAVAHVMHSATFTPFARPSSGSAELCLWRVELAPQSTGVAHRVLREEVFTLTAGGAEITVDGERSTLEPADVAVAPAGSTVRVDNPTQDTAVFWVAAPVGFTGELPDGTLIAPPWAA
jgi:quercetin dioxygenase-like cupin family protein